MEKIARSITSSLPVQVHQSDSGRAKTPLLGAHQSGSITSRLETLKAAPKPEISGLQKVLESVIKFAIKELAELGATKLGELLVGWVRGLLNPEPAVEAATGSVAQPA